MHDMEKMILDEIEKMIKEDDEQTRKERALRMKYLVEQFGESRHLLFHGGQVPLYAFHEARNCYINGQFIGCILLSQVVLEYQLSSLFYLIGDEETSKAYFSRILRKALEKKFISQEEYQFFDKLRKLRNPYSHFKNLNEEESLFQRMIKENNYDFKEISEKDARLAIGCVFNLLSRKPFAFYED